MSWVTAFTSFSATGAVLGAAALTLAVAACFRIWRRRSPELHKRGVLIENHTPWRRGAKRRGPRDGTEVTLAGVAIPFADETKHFKLIGTTGTGKSTAIRELLGAALARGDRAVFADPDGGYAANFLSRYRGDILLNPFDRASVKWDVFSEIREPFDVEELASGLIPTSNDAAAGEWRGYARTFLAAVLRNCHAQRRRDSAELWRLLSMAPVEEVQRVVAGTSAQPFLEADNARMFSSIRSVAIAAMAAFAHVQAQRATPFSVRRWVSGNLPGVLFIPYKAGQIAALKSMIATWMRLAIFEAMNGAENRDQRLWFVMDELDALGAVDGLKDALARLRKFGGRCVIGFQSLAQVSSTYGTADGQTIIENCGNTIIFRCSGSEQGGTAQFASRLIGEREILRRQISHGRDRGAAFAPQGSRRSRSTSEQHVTEAAVMPSQLEQLPDLCGYFKSASSRSWRRVRVSPRRSTQEHP